MKSLMSLWSSMATEMAIRCCTSATLDIKYVESRVEHEGLSFLAITLADFGKGLQKGLDRGFVVPSDFSAFKRAGGPIGLPAFLRGFLGRVFHSSSGVLLDEPCITTIHALRQLTLVFSKIALPEDASNGYPHTKNDRKVVSRVREGKAMQNFVLCEQEVRDSDARLDPIYLDEFKRMSAMLFGDLFAKVDRDVYWGRNIPKHGPGAVADRLSSNGKYDSLTWVSRLERCFPARAFLRRREDGEEYNFLEPGSELPVRVISVPKTLKTPRIIAIEPAAMQYAQQSLLHCIRSALVEDDFLSGLIGIDDQTPNQRLARSGSLSGDLATLDLSDASDRVSNQHVRAMTEDFPDLFWAIQSCRSRKADVPGHGVIRLAKFACMGSALCFPIEAMVFATIIFMGIQRELSTPLDRDTLIRRYRDSVRVFGDDLIVPRDHVLSVVDELSTFGCKVNVGKSYWIGRFRESCGKEYYDGHDVSIVKVRSVLPTRLQQADRVEATVALRNLFYKDLEWSSASWLDDYLRKLLVRGYPNVASSSPLLGRVSFLGWEFQRLDPNTHAPLVKGYKRVAKPPPDLLDGYGALLKCLLMDTSNVDKRWRDTSIDDLYTQKYREPSVDTEHLERAGRPERVDIKLGWASPF